ncbi:amidase [Plantibacter flavus]|uniref:amidase n=1 Tax=Plantibacter TaxID=190323 RepID=UPI0010C16A8E|nr:MULTISPECIES: amidase [Plantibacter]MBD8468320.1 amidase [Plantibacter sp. CFBP 8798]MDD9154298.1 amidase [Plantibacter flavus]TKJ96438.1 amidase [Plantibacter flavus]
MAELHELTALEQWQALQRDEVSPTELARHYLDRIERLDDAIGAFTSVAAGSLAERVEAVEALPRTAPLWGLPIGDKDLVSRAGQPVRFGSRLTAEVVATTDDELVGVLDRAGAVSLGKTATPEFGLYGYTEPLDGVPTRNPWALDRGAAGSSGGAAAAVAARLLPFAPGSDGGGSVRIPAAACGLVGLKPTRGLVPAGSGVDRLAGLVVPGPIARTVADAALLLDAMIERVHGRIDHHFTLRAPDADDGPLLGHAVRGEGRFQLAVLDGSPWDSAFELAVDPEARAAVDVATRAFTAMGHGLEELTLRDAERYPTDFTTIWQASAAGVPASSEAELALLEPITRSLVERGRALPATRLMETLASLHRFERSVLAQFAPFDAIITPALAQTPRPIGWYDQDSPELNFEQQVRYAPHTSFVNATGLPAITLPVHETSEGLPMGVQLIGRPGGEATLLALGAQLERRLRWQDRVPSVAR